MTLPKVFWGFKPNHAGDPGLWTTVSWVKAHHPLQTPHNESYVVQKCSTWNYPGNDYVSLEKQIRIKTSNRVDEIDWNRNSFKMRNLATLRCCKEMCESKKKIYRPFSFLTDSTIKSHSCVLNLLPIMNKVDHQPGKVTNCPGAPDLPGARRLPALVTVARPVRLSVLAQHVCSLQYSHFLNNGATMSDRSRQKHCLVGWYENWLPHVIKWVLNMYFMATYMIL